MKNKVKFKLKDGVLVNASQKIAVSSIREKIIFYLDPLLKLATVIFFFLTILGAALIKLYLNDNNIAHESVGAMLNTNVLIVVAVTAVLISIWFMALVTFIPHTFTGMKNSLRTLFKVNALRFEWVVYFIIAFSPVYLILYFSLIGWSSVYFVYAFLFLSLIIFPCLLFIMYSNFCDDPLVNLGRIFAALLREIFVALFALNILIVVVAKIVSPLIAGDVAQVLCITLFFLVYSFLVARYDFHPKIGFVVSVSLLSLSLFMFVFNEQLRGALVGFLGVGSFESSYYVSGDVRGYIPSHAGCEFKDGNILDDVWVVMMLSDKYIIKCNKMSVTTYPIPTRFIYGKASI